MQKEKAFVGRREKGIYNDNDVYLSFPEHLYQRDNYGLEPVFSNSAIGDNVFYDDLLNAMFNKGMLTNDHTRLFNSKTFTVNLPIDADKFVNWSLYYWVGEGFFTDGSQASNNKHYITVGKSVGTFWGENNSWYHYDDIRQLITSDNKHLIEQAKRPIIEFDSRLNFTNGAVTSWAIPEVYCSDGNDYKIFTYVTNDLHPFDTELGFAPKLVSNDYNSEYVFNIDLPEGVDFFTNGNATPMYVECDFNYRNLRHEFGSAVFDTVELTQDAKSQNDIDVYVDGIKQIGNYTYDNLVISFTEAVTGNLYVDYKTADNVVVDGDSVWQRINPAIEYNVDNEYYDNKELSYTVVYEHLVRLIETTDTLTGEPNGVNNFREIGDNADKLRFNNLGSVMVRNSIDIKKAYFAITRDDYDPVKAVEFLSTSYNNFKNKLVTVVKDILSDASSDTKTTTEILEQAITEIGLAKRANISVFDGSEMINFGVALSHYTAGSIDVSIGSRFQPIPNDMISSILDTKNLSVYLNGSLQTNVEDYVLSGSEIIFNTYVGIAGDVIDIRYYERNAEAFVPPSSTSLDINELYVPGRITDTEYNPDVEMIVGHDGSLVPAWGDRTDDILLEFETLIFNRLVTDRTDTQIKRFGYGMYRYASEEYSFSEKKYVQYPFFKKWMIRNNIDNLYNDIFDADDWKTWNYRSLNDQIPGNWRGIMQYVYGTDNPVAEPWVTVGLSQKPDGFDVYGTDYTQETFWNNIKIAFSKEWPVPVDSNGQLETISNLFFANTITTSDVTLLDQDWEFGDGSPVEMAWRRSSEYAFAEFLLMLLTKPFEVIDNYNQQIDGIMEFYHAREGYSTLAITAQRKQYEFKLGSKLGGFVNNFRLLSENSGLSNSRYTDIPRDNYDLFVHAGEPNRSESFSALVIEKVSIDASYPTYAQTDTASYIAGDIILNPYDKKHYKRKTTGETTRETENTVKFDYSVWTLISQPVTREFGYRVHGYDDFNTVFFTMDWDKTSGQKVWSTEGDLANLKVWTSGEYYRQDSYTVYNNKSYVSLINHTASTSFDDDISNWKLLPEWPRINQTTAYGYKETLPDQVRTHSYGDILSSIDEVAQLMVGYQAYLKVVGWDFTDVDDDNQVVDFETLLEKFLDWSTETHQPGDFITLTPVLFSGAFETPYGVATVGRETNKNFYRVVDEAGRQIPTTEIEFNSANGKITWESRVPIYGIKIDVADIEQAFVVDRIDSYGDVIYDPFTHNRNLRMIVDCNRTSDWDGTLAADGYIVSNNALIPNLETMVSETQFYRDTLVDQSLQNVNNLKANQIGYSPRAYLRNHGIERESQLEFYKGFLAGKSTVSSINRIINNNSNFDDLKHRDVWAIKLADYGRLGNKLTSWSTVNTIDIISDPHVVNFANGTIPSLTTAKTVAIKSAGYVNPNDVNYIVATNDDLTLSTTPYYEGDTAWVRFDSERDWDVQRLNEIAEINYISETEDGQLTVALSNEIDTDSTAYLKIINSSIEPEIEGNYYFVKDETISSANNIDVYEYLVFDQSFEPLIVEIDTTTNNSVYVPSTSAVGVEAIGSISNPVITSGDSLMIDGEVFTYTPGGGTTSGISIGGETATADPIVSPGEKVRVVVYGSDGLISNTNTLVTFNGTNARASTTTTSNFGDQFSINDETLTVDFSAVQSISTTSDATTSTTLTTGHELIIASGTNTDTISIADIVFTGTVANPVITETKSMRVGGIEIKFIVPATPADVTETFTATAAQTDFTIAQALSVTTYSVGTVTVDSVATTDYTVVGQILTLNSPAIVGGEIVEIELTHVAQVLDTQTIINTINASGLGVVASITANDFVEFTTSASTVTITGSPLSDFGMSSTVTATKLGLLTAQIDALSYVSARISNTNLVITTDEDTLSLSGSAFNDLGFPTNTYSSTSDPTATSIVAQIQALNIPNVTADVSAGRIRIKSAGAVLEIEEVTSGAMARLGYNTTTVVVNSIDSIVSDLNTALGDLPNSNVVKFDRRVLITSDENVIVLSNVSGNALADIGINAGTYNNISTASTTAAEFKDQINAASADIVVSITSDGRMVFTSSNTAMTFSGTLTTLLDTIGLYRDYTSVTSNSDFKVMRWKSIRFTPNYNGETFDEFYNELGLNAASKIWADDYQNAGWAILDRGATGVLSILNKRSAPINTDYVSRITARSGDNFYNYQLFDPLNFKMAGSITTDIDYVSWNDPAKYDIAVNDALWLDQYLGTIWWDTDAARYYRYDDFGDAQGNADISYATRFWGKLVPGSEIKIKQWVVSETLADDIDVYNTEVLFDSVRNKKVRRYYYWTTIGDEPRYSKEYSVAEIAMMIESPTTINKFFPVTKDIAIVSDSNSILSNPTIKYGMDYRTGPNISSHHSDWELISRTSTDALDANFLLDLQESIAGSKIENYESFEVTTDSAGISFSYDWLGTNSLSNADVVVTINNRIVDEDDFSINFNQVTIDTSIDLVTGDIIRLYHVVSHSGWFDNITSARNNFASVIRAVLDKQMIKTKFPMYYDYIALDHGIFATDNWSYSDEYATIEHYGYLSRTRDIDMISLYNSGVTSFKIDLTSEGNEYYFPINNEIRLVHKENSVLNLDFEITELTVQDSQRLTEKQASVQIHELLNMMYEFATTAEIKTVFFDMIEYMYTEKTHPEWIFKTSYIDLTMFNKPLRQYAIYQRDSYQDTIDYVTETKPYHTKIRTTQRVYPLGEAVTTEVDALHTMTITKFFGDHSRFELNTIDSGDAASDFNKLDNGEYEGGKFLRNDIEYTASADGFDTGPFHAYLRDAAVVTVDTFTDATKTTLDKREFYVYDVLGRGYHIPVTDSGTISSFDGTTLIVDQASKFRASKSNTVHMIALENANGDLEFMLYDNKSSNNLRISSRVLFNGIGASFANGSKVHVLGAPNEIYSHQDS